MGRLTKWTGNDNVARYTARYTDERGKERSAGTFRSETAAKQAVQRAESKVAKSDR